MITYLAQNVYNVQTFLALISALCVSLVSVADIAVSIASLILWYIYTIQEESI